MQRDEDDLDLEKYVKYELEELLTLRESYKAKIAAREENHWLTKVQRNCRFNLWRIITYVLYVSLGLVIVSMALFAASLSLEKQFVPESVFFIIFGIGLGVILILVSIADDGTSNLRRQLRNVNLIMDKKEFRNAKKIMIDSNIFHQFVSGNLKKEDIDRAKRKNFKFYMTHIQSDEVSECSEDEKRKKLSLFIATVAPEIVPTESTIVGLSRAGFSKLNEGDLIFEMRKDNPDLKKSKDLLIAETSIKNDYILLTNDIRLIKAVRRFGGKAMSLEEFLDKIK